MNTKIGNIFLSLPLIALPVYNVTPFTLLDFPGKTACIVWFAGCNMRCLYCHNPRIVNEKGKVTTNQVLDFLSKRKGLLDGVVLSGGEAMLYKGLLDFALTIKNLGFMVKLDTNGTSDSVIQKMVNERLVDYIALDYKAPWKKFYSVTKTKKFESFQKTLSFLCTQKDTPFEVRTTVHSDLLNEQDIECIIGDLESKQYKGTYYIQNYSHTCDTLGGLLPQNQILDCSRLKKPKGFYIEYRNF